METNVVKQRHLAFIMVPILIIVLSMQGTSYGQTGNPKITASAQQPLTEAKLHGSVVTLTLSGRSYVRSEDTIRETLWVTGIEDITIKPWNVKRQSDTVVTVQFTFAGDFDADAILTFTLGAKAFAKYEGPALTTKIPVSSVQESIVASTESPLTAATLHGGVVTLTLNGRSYVRTEDTINETLWVTGIEGITIKPWNVKRQSDTVVTVQFTFNGKLDADAVLTFMLGAKAFANYEGPALTTKIPVTLKDRKKEDVNGDGTVNIQDLVLVAANFGQTGETPADVNEDGIVNIQDLVLVAGAFGDNSQKV